VIRGNANYAKYTNLEKHEAASERTRLPSDQDFESTRDDEKEQGRRNFGRKEELTRGHRAGLLIELEHTREACLEERGD
jgi:hypothetical protein